MDYLSAYEKKFHQNHVRQGFTCYFPTLPMFRARGFIKIWFFARDHNKLLPNQWSPAKKTARCVSDPESMSLNTLRWRCGKFPNTVYNPLLVCTCLAFMDVVPTCKRSEPLWEQQVGVKNGHETPWKVAKDREEFDRIRTNKIHELLGHRSGSTIRLLDSFQVHYNVSMPCFRGLEA